MRKSYIFIIAIYVTGIIVTSFIFVKKHDIQYVNVHSLSTKGNPFYPDAFEIINEQKEMDSYTRLLGLQEINLNSVNLDFSKYTYIIVHGAKVKRMYWSFKQTLFNDSSPSYAKAYRKGKKCLFIQYLEPDGGIYLYKINKDLSLSNSI